MSGKTTHSSEVLSIPHSQQTSVEAGPLVSPAWQNLVYQGLENYLNDYRGGLKNTPGSSTQLTDPDLFKFTVNPKTTYSAVDINVTGWYKRKWSGIALNGVQEMCASFDAEVHITLQENQWKLNTGLPGSIKIFNEDQEECE